MARAIARAAGADLRRRLADAFVWRTDRGEDREYADLTGWWRDPEILAELGAGLAGLYERAWPSVVLGPQSRGVLLGSLTAAALGVGFVEARKNPSPAADSDAWVRRTSAPDYRDRHVEFGFRRDLIGAGDRVLMVDDWVATGATALAARGLVADRGADWIGVAAVVDALVEPQLRRWLPVRALLHHRDLR